MHHSLKLYGSHRKTVLNLYMFFGSWSKLPLVGRLVRKIADVYARRMHRACLLTPQEAEELIELAEGVAIAPCTCRRLYHKCDNPWDNEILLGPTRRVLIDAMSPDTREIGKDEAAAIIRESHRRGLILTVLKCRGDYYAICSCCSCCCVPLRLSKRYGIGEVMVRHKDIVKEFRDYQTAYGDLVSSNK